MAEAEREKAIQVANANKLREIGTREAREQASLAQLDKDRSRRTDALERADQGSSAAGVRIAELDKEQKVGEQTAGFEREAQVKDAERTMRIAAGRRQRQGDRRRGRGPGRDRRRAGRPCR